MSAENLIGLILVRAAARLPRRGLPRPGEVLMSAAAWAQLAFLIVAPGDLDPAARRLHGQGVRRTARRRATASSCPVERLDLPRRAASIPTASSAGPSTRSRCSRSASSALLLLYAMQRLQTVAAVQPDARAAGRRGAVVQHRGQLRHQHELAELLPRSRRSATSRRWSGSTVQNFVSAAVGHGGDGRADPGPRPSALRHDRQLLGRPHPRRPCASSSRSRSSARSSTSAPAWSRTSTASTWSRRSRADRR